MFTDLKKVSGDINLVYLSKDTDGLQSRLDQSFGINYFAIAYSSSGTAGKKDGVYVSIFSKDNKLVSNFQLPFNTANNPNIFLNIAFSNEELIAYYLDRSKSPTTLKVKKFDLNGIETN